MHSGARRTDGRLGMSPKQPAGRFGIWYSQVSPSPELRAALLHSQPSEVLESHSRADNSLRKRAVPLSGRSRILLEGILGDDALQVPAGFSSLLPAMDTYITRVHVDNFKLLQGFEVRLKPFNCLVGVNGIGKTTILEALGFIGAVMSCSVSAWLDTHGYRASDIPSGGFRRSNISFEVDIRLPQGFARWSAKLNMRTLRCSSESIILAADESFREPRTCMTMSRQRLITGGKTYAVKHNYEGSALGSFQAQEVKQCFDPVCREVRHLLSSIRSPGRLNPSKLRSAFGFDKGTGRKCHISDGILRIIGISDQLKSEGSLICIDEVENGICMDMYRSLAESLVNSAKQVVVTANSPQFLNCLSDEAATSCTQLVHLDLRFLPRATPVLSLTALKDSLTMYPLGDALRRAGLAELGRKAAAAYKTELHAG